MQFEKKMSTKRNVFTLNYETPFSVHLLQNTDNFLLKISSARTAVLRKVVQKVRLQRSL